MLVLLEVKIHVCLNQMHSPFFYPQGTHETPLMRQGMSDEFLPHRIYIYIYTTDQQ